MILFLDIESDVSGTKIKEIGLVKGNHSYKGRDLSRINEFVSDAKWICGHNLLTHDLPILQEAGFGRVLDGLEVIDTLLLCPLLKPDLGRHKLAKDYLINDISKSDPVYDAELARQLLFDLAELWSGLPTNVQKGIKSILYQQKGFQGFFQWLDWERNTPTDRVFEPALIRNSFWDYSNMICVSVDLELLCQTFPIELAYVLALVKTEDPKIFTPSWMLGNFPNVQEVFHRLRSKDCGDPSCSYCAGKLNPVEGLKEFFGYPGFRTFEGDEDMPLQEKVVRSALRG